MSHFAFIISVIVSLCTVAQAVLPAMFRLDGTGRPQRDADYLESARVVETEPKQVVVYRLNQQAVWSDGREIGAADFAAQWRALSGKDSAYWTARNAGYDRIESVDADVIADGRRGDPGGVLLELEGAWGDAIVVVEGQMQCAEEGQQGDDEGSPLLEAVTVGQQSKDDGPGERDEGDDRQDVVVDVHRRERPSFLNSLSATRKSGRRS